MTELTELRLKCPRCGAALEGAGGNLDGIRCLQCGAVHPIVDGIPSFMPLDAGHDRVQNFFDDVASHLTEDKLSYAPEKAVTLDRQFNVLANAFVCAVERWVPSDGVVLDVGCGHGALLERAIQRHHFVGIDMARDMLPYARKRGYAVYHGDATALPFQDAQFDTVICGEVLQHFPDPTTILAELARVSRPGATVIVSTLNRHSIARFVRRTVHSFTAPKLPLPIILRTAEEVANAAANVSLTLDEVAWVLSPTRAVAYSRIAKSPADPLSTNFILRLRA